jgi:hypothetical protein
LTNQEFFGIIGGLGWEILRVRSCIEFRYPEFSGCYALVKGGRVVYVGQSKNVLLRLSTHRNTLRRLLKGKANYAGARRVVIHFDSVKLYPCPESELTSLERELIMFYNPELNVIIPKRAIDIRTLMERAQVTEEELNQWKLDVTRTYTPKEPKRDYRRVAA